MTVARRFGRRARLASPYLMLCFKLASTNVDI